MIQTFWETVEIPHCLFKGFILFSKTMKPQERLMSDTGGMRDLSFYHLSIVIKLVLVCLSSCFVVLPICPSIYIYCLLSGCTIFMAETIFWFVFTQCPAQEDSYLSVLARREAWRYTEASNRSSWQLWAAQIEIIFALCESHSECNICTLQNTFLTGLIHGKLRLSSCQRLRNCSILAFSKTAFGLRSTKEQTVA